MRTKMAWLNAIVVVALGLTLAGTSLAQTTTTVGTRNFEVIAVDGNTLVVRDEKGAQEIKVPDDFRFTVDGKKMAVSDLKPGMKGTATITTTTTMKPVNVAELREAEVLRASDLSVTVRMADGTRRYTREELDKGGIRVLKDGKPVQLGDLKRGDKLTATIITAGPPVTLTEQEVQATLAEPKGEPAAPKAPTTVAAAPAAAPAATAAATPPAVPPPSAAPPPTPPAAPAGLGPMWWILIIVVVAIVLFMVMRGKKKA